MNLLRNASYMLIHYLHRIPLRLQLMCLFIASVVIVTSCNVGSTNDSSSSIYFPKKRAGLSGGEALMEGQLVLENGYIRLIYIFDVEPTYVETSYFLIWPYGFSLNTESEEIKILDENGNEVARVGENILVGGGEAPAAEVKVYMERELPDDAEGPYWIVSDVIDNNSPAGQ